MRLKNCSQCFLKGWNSFAWSEIRNDFSILKDLKHAWVVNPIGLWNFKHLDQHLFLQPVECCAAEQEMTTVHKVHDTNQLHLLIFNSEASSKLANGVVSFIKDNQVKLTQQAEVCLCKRSEVDVNLVIREDVIKLFLQSI